MGRGLQLTSQLLAFAKQQELEPRPGNVNELLNNLKLLLGYAAGPGVRIVLELASDMPECLIDPPQFNAAVLNLVVNARDAMPNGGDVVITTGRWEAKSSALGSPNSWFLCPRSRQGQRAGYAEAVLEKIFDPLFTTKGEKGTGLGLPQVCAFMRLIGGPLSCQRAGTRNDVRSAIPVYQARSEG